MSSRWFFFFLRHFNAISPDILKNFIIYLAVLSLWSCAQTLHSCGEQGSSRVVVCSLLIATASPVGEHGL